MAHIKKMTDKPRRLLWRSQVRHKGLPTLVKFFKTEDEATFWGAEQDRSVRLTGLPLTNEDLKKHTVGEIVERYLNEITPTKASHVSETTVLKAFLQRDICKKSLAYVKRQDAHTYLDARLTETWNGKVITPRTVRRELNTIQHIFEVAKDRWGYENLVNPFRGVPIKGSSFRRTRRLEPGELGKLDDACQQCRGLNRSYVALAIYLAIETGMRLQEIFNLTWEDIDIGKRQIRIRKSKTDHMTAVQGRTIVLTVMAQMFLCHLFNCLAEGGKLPGRDRIPVPHIKLTGRIFPLSKGAFQQSWADVVKRAKIKDLHFHDLRREAGSRFHDAGLSVPEQNLMMGHSSQGMHGLYIEADLKRIQDKLDKHLFKGETFDEISARVASDGIPEQEIIKVRALHNAYMRGLTREQRSLAVNRAAHLWETQRKEQPSEFLENFLFPFAQARAS